MRAAKLLVLLTFAAGCGGDGKPANDVVGQWYFAREDVACGTGLSLAADESYELVVVCKRLDGGYDVQKTLGRYMQSTDGDTLTLSPQLWSCAGTPGAVTSYRLDFVSDKLRLVSSADIIILERLPDDAEVVAGAARFGCFDSAGGFTPRPVQ